MDGSTMVSTDQDSFEERARICQAQGCEVNVNPFGRYCRKRRLCPEHLKAPSLRRKKYGDEKWRFCQQCGKLELIKNFDGLKRSCRVQLARRRAANTHKGERRRSNATEPSRSADNSSGAASPSQDDAQPGNGNYTSSGPDGDPAQQPSAAAAAAAAAAGSLHGSAAIAAGGVTGCQMPAAAEASDTAAAGGCSSDYQRAEGQTDMSLASYMQYGLESALLLGQQPAAQQPHPGQQQQPGSLLPSQPNQRALFSLQQQQQQQQDAAALQEHIDMSLAEQLQGQQQQQQQRARGTANAAASAGCFPPPSSAALAAGSNMQSSSSDLLLQLLREQQLRSWQQLQPAGPLSHPQLLEHHQDVYTMALDTGIGNSTGLGAANAGAAIKGQPQQLSVQQQQQSISQHSLQPQRQSLESQTYTGATARTGSSGSLPAGSAAAAAEAPFLGLDSSALRPGVIKHEIIAGQQQYVPSSFADALPHASFAMLQDMGRGVPQSGFQQQQQLMQQPQADPFRDPTYNSQPGWPRSSTGPTSDYQAIEDLLIGGMPAALQTSNLCNPEDSSGPINLRSLSALEGCHSFGPVGNRQPQLRGIDSAPPQLGSFGGAGTAGACAATSSIHSSSSGTSYLTLPGMQGGQPGRSTAGQLPSSTSVPVGPALSGPMTLYPVSADAAGVGGVAVSGPQVEFYWPAAAAVAQGAQGVDPYRQQPLQRMEYAGGNLWAPAGADAIKQQQAELQAIFDGASAAAAAAAAAGVGGQMPWPNPGMQDQPFPGNMQGQ